MSETKFTLGPWKNLEASENFCIEVIKDDSEGLPLGPNWIGSVHQQFTSRENGEANARLIAAAPEMYELLETIQSYFNSFSKEWKEGEAILTANISGILNKINP